MDQRERIRKKTGAIWKDAKYASVGLEFGISIAACYYIGDWAQERWDFAIFSKNPGCLSIFKVVMPAAVAKGFPLKVPAW